MANIVHCITLHKSKQTHYDYLLNVSIYGFVALFAGCHNSYNVHIKLPNRAKMVNDLRDKQNHELHAQKICSKQ